MIRRFIERRRFKREHRWTQAHVSEFLEHELDGDERERLHDHVGICPQCRRVLATLRRMLESLRTIGSERTSAATDPAVAAGVIERLRSEV